MTEETESWDEWYKEQSVTEDDFADIIGNKETSIQKARKVCFLFSGTKMQKNSESPE